MATNILNRRIIYTPVLATGGVSGGPTWVYAGSDTTFSSTASWTSTTINIGSAAADRRVVIAGSDQNGVALTGPVTVNGVTMVLDASATDPGNAAPSYIYSAIVASGSGACTIVIPYDTAAGSTDRQMNVYVGRGGISTTVKNAYSHVGGNQTIGVTADPGDFLLSASINGSNMPSPPCTEAGVLPQIQTTTSSIYICSSMWNTIVGSYPSGSFTIDQGYISHICAASYR